jgi:hypothetical protein
MKSPNYFIIKPLNDARYDNVRKYGNNDFIISSSTEDHRIVNRYAVVHDIPINYNGAIKPGDTIIVHHNIFRITYGYDGKPKNSWSFYKDNIFLINLDQIFCHKSDTSEWKSIFPYVFIKPSDEQLYGTVKYVPEEKINVSVGDEITFRPEMEYQFQIEDEKLYRMRYTDLCLKI